MMIKDSASFRDRSGFVFTQKRKIYRWISPEYLPQYRMLMDSGLYQELLSRRLIVAHREVELDGVDADGGLIIQPKRIPFISYPYEWCFEQYQDAALATLDIQRIALNYGMVLKDASAYNIQFLNGYAVLIDTLSFDFYQVDSPWGAYGQFCRHFLAPLMLMSYEDERLSKLMQVFIDGIPLDLASKLLHGGGLFAKMHIHMHAKSIEKHSDDGKKGSLKQGSMSKSSLITFCDSLRQGTAKLQPKQSLTEWGDYYANTNYTDAAAESKTAIVKEMLASVDELKYAWDFGANDGRYSKLAVEAGAHAVAFDMDQNAVARNWRSVKENHEKMLPLILDLSAPSPAIGFANEERATIGARQHPDVIMMLAVIHHMAISNNLPLSKIAEWLSGMCRYLLIEFVPKTDSQVQVLLATRADIFPDYDELHFESAFSTCFTLKEKRAIQGSARTLYLWESAQ